jgi:3-phosphoshikimate 1-carboxyvinyltransferase
MHARSSSLDLQPAGHLRGVVCVPGDKSLSHRYALLAGIARGVTRVHHLAPGADVSATLSCLSALGVEIRRGAGESVELTGRGPAGFSAPGSVLDAANSGTTLRLLAGLLAPCHFRATLDGDASLRRRPMRRVIDPLVAMGARIDSDDGRAPLTIHGGTLRGVHWTSPVASAQVKSAVLFAGLSAEGVTTVTEPAATRDHTERVFPTFGLEVERRGTRVEVRGSQQAIAPAEPLVVAGDPSSAAVWACAAAARPGSDVRLEDVCLNPRRLGFVRVLTALGARVDLDQTGERAGEPVGTIRVRHGGAGAAVVTASDVPDVIDELPVLAACAALGGSLSVSGASELRVKESDRISALVTGLRALGVDADERPDGFEVRGGARAPAGGQADAASDHRLVMAFAIVALGASGPTRITGADVVAVSYPDFVQDLTGLTS